jgi:hypothetical protein
MPMISLWPHPGSKRTYYMCTGNVCHSHVLSVLVDDTAACIVRIRCERYRQAADTQSMRNEIHAVRVGVRTVGVVQGGDLLREARHLLEPCRLHLQLQLQCRGPPEQPARTGPPAPCCCAMPAPACRACTVLHPLLPLHAQLHVSLLSFLEWERTSAGW